LNINLGSSRSQVLLLGAISVFAIIGLLSAIPVHAQTTTTTTQGTTSSTPYSMGQGCPNMGSSSGTTSNTSTSSSGSSTSSG